MSEIDVIQSTLERAAQRRRWNRSWVGLWHGVFFGALLWAGCLIVYKLAPIPVITLRYAGLAAGVLVAGGFVWGWLRKPTLKQTARWVDSRQHLHERLSTALEMADQNKDQNWSSLLIADAARFASQVDPRKLSPVQLPRITRWAMLVLVLGAGLGFVPEYRSKAFIEKKQDAQAIHEAGAKIVELTKHNLEQRPPVLEPTRKALESVEEMGMQMASNSLTRTEALKNIATATEKIKSELKQVSPPALKALEKAARSSNSKSGSQSDAELQKRIDEMQKELGKAADGDAVDKLKEDLRKAQQAAANMPDASTPAGAAARDQISQKLADLAKDAKSVGQNVPGLDDAIAAFKENRIDDFVRDMDTATTDLNKLQEMTQTLQQLQKQQANSEPGKDLPSQLKNGETDAAKETMAKMAEQLKSPGLSQDKLKSMLDEVSRSVDPASSFGQAAAKLKEAAKQMESGNKSDAAKSLAQASQELDKAMSDLQDAKSLAATLDALKKAETAVATRRGWGQSPSGSGDGSGAKCLEAGHGLDSKGVATKSRSGVGTWTDDDSKLYPEMSDSWNNDGVVRPDSDPRGPANRPDQQLSDNLAPTKVRGNLNPAGPMPSITLKGVSIKGQSGVEYQEAETAAQSAAQSALNQDQVPRAYQGAVRDYFDDLKK